MVIVLMDSEERDRPVRFWSSNNDDFEVFPLDLTDSSLGNEGISVSLEPDSCRFDGSAGFDPLVLWVHFCDGPSRQCCIPWNDGDPFDV